MTDFEILTIATVTMDRWLDRHWKVKLEDTLPSTAGGELAGHTSWDSRTIRISRRAVASMTGEEVCRMIEHEIAHALTPEDWTHGDVFKAKLKEIRA